MTKTKNPTKCNTQLNKKKNKESSYTHYEDYLCTTSFKMRPMSERGLNRLAIKVREWAIKKDAFLVADCLDELGILPTTYLRWRNRNTKLQTAHDFMLRRIASNREVGALTRRLDASMVKYKQYKYDKEWKEADAYHAELRQKEVAGSGSITVITQPIPNSDMVPTKVLEETPDANTNEGDK